MNRQDSKRQVKPSPGPIATTTAIGLILTSFVAGCTAIDPTPHAARQAGQSSPAAPPASGPLVSPSPLPTPTASPAQATSPGQTAPTTKTSPTGQTAGQAADQASPANKAGPIATVINALTGQASGSVVPLTADQLLKHWPRYKSAAGNYTIAFPKAPTEETSQLAARAQPIQVSIARQQDAATGLFLVTAYSPIARSQRSAIDRVKTLDSARDRLAQTLSAKLLSETKIQQNGQEGRELILHRPGFYMAKARLVYANEALYQAIAGVRDGDLGRADIRAFFQSWQINKAPVSEPEG